MKKLIVFLSLLAMMTLATSCGDDEKEIFVDDPTNSVLGQWFASLPMEGETADLLSEDGEMAPYDRVVVVLSIFEKTCNSTMFYLYGDELINYKYGLYLGDGDEYTIDREGNITVINDPEFSAHFRSAKYEKGAINVSMTMTEGDISLVFQRPTAQQLQDMARWMEIVYSSTGYSDDDKHQGTDV